MALKVDPAAYEVDGGSVPVQDARRETRHSRMRLERSQELPDPVRRNDKVVVQKTHPVAGGRFSRTIISDCETVVAIQLQQPERGKGGPHIACRTVSRAVIADNEFQPVLRVVQPR